MTVIIPHKNDLLRLTGCVRLLKPQLSRNDEIVAVDNGSENRAEFLDTCRHLDIVAVDCRTPGSYAARNAGIEAAKYDNLVFTDSDCRPATNFLQAYRHWFLGAEKIAIGAGPIVVFPEDWGCCTAWECIDLVYGFRQREKVAGSGAVTANLAVTRAAIAACGPFRGDLLSGGDTEFSRRVSAVAPRGIEWIEGALVYHPARKDRQSHITKMKRVAVGLHARSKLVKEYAKAQQGSRLSLRSSALWIEIWNLKRVSLMTRIHALFCLFELRIRRRLFVAKLQKTNCL